MRQPMRFLAACTLFLAGLLIGAAETGLGQFKDLGLEYQRGNPLFVAAFREASAGPSRSTVRILCDGKEIALGVVIASDGWILTKAHDLHGLITCRLRDGRIADARITGVHQGLDLAMLQIPVRGLVPVQMHDSRSLAVGSWVVCPGLSDDPVAMGIVSVATRTLAPRYQNNDVGFLGVSVDDADGRVLITQVVADSPAARAGLKVQDVILALQTKKIAISDDFLNMMQQRRAGDAIALSIQRDREVLQVQATLARRPKSSRGDSQNHMGSELSSRTSGYATILQHDSVLQPRDCGGPLIDLDGRVVGINICRAGRTESWAIPAEVIQPHLAELMSGKLAPQAKPAPPRN